MRRSAGGLIVFLGVVLTAGAAGAEDSTTSSPSASPTVSPSPVEEIVGVFSGSLDPDALTQGLGELGEVYQDVPPTEAPWDASLEGFAPFVDDLNEQLNSPHVESDAFTSDARLRAALLEAIDAEPDSAARSELLRTLDEMDEAAEPLRPELDRSFPY